MRRIGADRCTAITVLRCAGLAKFNQVQGAEGELPAAAAVPAALAGAGGSRAPGAHASGTMRGASTLASEATGVCGTSYYIR